MFELDPPAVMAQARQTQPPKPAQPNPLAMITRGMVDLARRLVALEAKVKARPAAAVVGGVISDDGRLILIRGDGEQIDIGQIRK